MTILFLDHKILMNKLFLNTNILIFYLFFYLKEYSSIRRQDPTTGFDTVVDPPQIPILMVFNFSIDFMF